MPRLFVSCKGKSVCRENSSHCLSCGREFDEIYGTRALIDELVGFAQKMDYQNTEEFFQYLVTKASKKMAHLNRKQ